MIGLRLTAQMRTRELALFNAPSSFGRSRLTIDKRVAKFVSEERRIRQDAADTATRTSRNTFQYVRPFSGAKRPGRSSTGGRLASFITWRPTKSGFVAFNLSEMDSKARHWVIQEVGTGNSANMRAAMPGGGDQVVRSVSIPSQIGRVISNGLVWAASPGGPPVPPSGVIRNQQLYLRARMSNRGTLGKTGGVADPRDPMRITREIRAQHFVRKGGEQGFRQYETNVLAAARSAFKKGTTL